MARLLNEAHDRAKEILEGVRDLLDRLSDVLVEREVIDGKDLKEYAEGTKPIPTKEELQEEGREKAKAAQDGNGQRKVGPEIIASAPPGLIPESQPIPARPD